MSGQQASVRCEWICNLLGWSQISLGKGGLLLKSCQVCRTVGGRTSEFPQDSQGLQVDLLLRTALSWPSHSHSVSIPTTPRRGHLKTKLKSECPLNFPQCFHFQNHTPALSSGTSHLLSLLFFSFFPQYSSPSRVLYNLFVYYDYCLSPFARR